MRYATIGLFLMLLAGCKEVSAPIEPRNDPWPDPRVSLTSQNLRENIAIKPALVERRNGILFVTLPIRSVGNLDLHLDYRVTFFNDNGVPLPPPGSWESMRTLPANVQSELQFNSVSANAADWRVELRYAE